MKQLKFIYGLMWTLTGVATLSGWAQSSRSAQEFLRERTGTNGVLFGVGVGSGGLGAERTQRERSKSSIKSALSSQRASERVAAWGTSLKFLVEDAMEVAEKKFKRSSTAASAASHLMDSLYGIQDAIKESPSITGAHTPNLIKRLIKLCDDLETRLKMGRTSEDGQESVELPRVSLARYRILEKILTLILDVETGFDEKYIVPKLYSSDNVAASDASSEMLQQFHREFRRVVGWELAFINTAMTKPTRGERSSDGRPGDGVRNEVPYSVYLNFSELMIEQVIEDLSHGIYGYRSADAVLRLGLLRQRLAAFNLNNDRSFFEDAKDAFEETFKKINEIQTQYLPEMEE
jgi:hypothetical protein